jgi:hypothetical protein
MFRSYDQDSIAGPSECETGRLSGNYDAQYIVLLGPPTIRTLQNGSRVHVCPNYPRTYDYQKLRLKQNLVNFIMMT